MAGTAAYVDVLPNLAAFGAQLVKKTSAAASSAGKTAGSMFSRAMSQASSNNAVAKQVEELKAAEQKAVKAVQDATKQIAQARNAQKASAKQLEAAEAKLNETTTKYGASSSQALAAEARKMKAADQLKQRELQVERAENVLREAQNQRKEATNQLSDAESRASNTSVKHLGVLGRLRTAYQQTGAGATGMATLTSKSTGRMSMAMGAVGGVAASVTSKVIGAFAGIGSEVIKASDATDKFKSTLGFAGIDTKTIDKLTASTQRYADRTVYELADVQNTTAQLAANGVPNYERLAEAAGNLNAVAGGNAETFKSVAMVLTQTAGVGKLTTENWNQLTDAIPGASGKLQQAMLKNGAYTGNFRKAMEQGEISADEFNQALMQLGMTDVAKKAATSTSTIEGAWGNLQASMVSFGTTMLSKVKKPLTSGLTWVADFTGSATTKLSALADFLATGKFSKAFQDAFNMGKDSQFFTFLTDVRDMVTTVFDTGRDKITGFMQGFSDTGALSAASKVFSQAWDAAKKLGTAIGSVAKEFGPLTGLAGNAADFGDTVGKAFRSAGKPVGQAAKALGSISDWVSKHSGACASALAAVAGGLAGFKVASFIVAAMNALKGFSMASTAAAAAQWALNVAMDANPIVLAVTAIAALVAALTWFFTQTETGRKIVSDAWNGIQSAVGAVTDWFQTYVMPVLSTVWDGIKAGLSALGSFFSTVWNAIKTAAQVAFLFITTVVITPFKLALDALGAAFSWLYEHVIQPAWDGIQSVMGIVWEWISANVLTPFSNGLNLLGEVFNWLYANIILPVWQGIETAFSTAWNWISSTVIAGWNAAINGMGAVFNWLYANIILPVWQGIQTAFSTAWNWINNNVVAPFKNGMAALGQSVQKMKDMAATAWNGLKDAAATPVRWVVNVVYTNGIQKVWNGIASAIGLNNLKLPDAHFASGGVMPGYTPGRDTMLAAVSGGEAIMRPEFTRAVGPQAIDTWNRLARTQGPQAVRDSMAGLPHYANGGVVSASQAIANANKATRGWAGLCLKFVKDMFHAAARFPSAISAWNGSASKHPTSDPNAIPAGAPVYFAPKGDPYGHVALSLGRGMMRTTNSSDGLIHTDPISQWVSWGYKLLGWTSDIEGQAIPGIGGASSGGGILDQFADFFADPGAWISNKILGPVRSMIAGIGSGNWGQMIGHLPVMVAEGLIDKAKSAVSSMFAGIAGNNSQGNPGGAGVERWRGTVLQALAMLGQPASWADTVLRRMNQESGGNPNAINNWDSNAKAGHPSQGLMQTIPGTFNAYAGPLRGRGILDPLANIYAAINYSIHRYGSIAGMNRPGGYALGGIVDPVPRLYDKGGWLPPGPTLVENRTRAPELVLTADQRRDLLGARHAAPYQPTINIQGPSADDVIAKMDARARRNGYVY